jgi:hypothetical protein
MANFELRNDQVRMRFDQFPDRLFDVVEIDPLSRRSVPVRELAKPPGDAGDRRSVRRTVGQDFDEALQPGSHEGGGHVAGLGSVGEFIHRCCLPGPRPAVSRRPGTSSSCPPFEGVRLARDG